MSLRIGGIHFVDEDETASVIERDAPRTDPRGTLIARLPPALHGWARTQTLESLSKFCAGLDGARSGAGRPVGAPSPIAALSATGRDVARQLGITDADFALEQQRRAAAPVELSAAARDVAAQLGLSPEQFAQAQTDRARELSKLRGE